VASLREAKAQERELDFEASLQSLRSRIAVRAPRDASFSMHSTSSSYGNHGPLSTGFSSTAGASASSIGPGAPAASPALMAARAPIPASRQLSGSRFAPDGNSSTVGRSGIPGVPLERGGSGPQGSSASHALGGATQTPPQTMPRASSLTVDSPGKGISSISGAMAGADAEPLPPGWEQKLDTPSGRVFYVNHRIRAISWERPGGSVVSERAAEPAKTAPAPAPAHDRASSLFGEAWRSGATLSGRFNSLASQGPVDGRGSAPSQRTPASAVEKAGEQTDSSIQLRSAGAARLQDVIDSPGSAIVSSAAPRPVSASLQVSTGERGQTDVTGITYSSASGLALPSSAVAGISPSKLSETEFMKKAAALLERRARGEGLGEGLGLGSTLDGGSLAIDHTHATKTSSWRSSASLYVPGGMRRSLDPARLSALARDVDSDVNAHSALRLGRRVEDEQTLDLLMKVSTVLQRGVKPREDPTGHGDWMDSGVDRRTSQFEFDIWARTVLPASPCPVLPALPAARDDTVCGLQPQILSQVPVDEDFLDENLLGVASPAAPLRAASLLCAPATALIMAGCAQGAQGYIRNRISSSFRRAEPVVQAQAKAPDPDLYAQTTWQI